VISGATRGTGLGGALVRHLLKDENQVTVLPGRGLGSATLAAQMVELVAQSAGGRTDRPIYHCFCAPDPSIADEAAARTRFWALFEKEFGMEGQPWCGVEHHKGGRRHEHRVYSLALPTGAVVDLRWDYLRREKCARIVEFEFGVAPVPSKFARAIAARLRRDGRTDIADWLVASGQTTAARPIARLTPRERMIEERTGISLDDLRRLTLAAWREGTDGASFLAALRRRGLDLREGRVGPVVIDASGAAYLATRLIGAGARRFEGERMPAEAVKDRLNGMVLERHHDGRDRHHAKAGRTGSAPARDPGGDRAALGGRGRIRRPDHHAVGPDGGGGRRHGRGEGTPLERLRAVSGAGGAALRQGLMRLNASDGRYLAAAERARAAIERIEEVADGRRTREWALWGAKDIWGLPLR
jgi:hypothetical protein